MSEHNYKMVEAQFGPGVTVLGTKKLK